jgi:hypothetical protein
MPRLPSEIERDQRLEAVAGVEERARVVKVKPRQEVRAPDVLSRSGRRSAVDHGFRFFATGSPVSFVWIASRRN